MQYVEQVAARPDEVRASRPGDGIVPDAAVVMDRAFDVPGSTDQVWPWLLQLGKRRAGWYLPRRLERSLPLGRRGLRHVDGRFTGLEVGDVIPDWGGKDETFTVVELQPPDHLVYRSQRGRTAVSWAICLRTTGESGTRVHLRLRLGPVKHVRLAERVGGAFDLATIALLAAGLRERLDQPERVS
ncbi:MAG: hypothetical protein ACR2HA_07945 [Nocardioides sp.]